MAVITKISKEWIQKLSSQTFDRMNAIESLLQGMTGSSRAAEKLCMREIRERYCTATSGQGLVFDDSKISIAPSAPDCGLTAVEFTAWQVASIVELFNARSRYLSNILPVVQEPNKAEGRETRARILFRLSTVVTRLFSWGVLAPEVRAFHDSISQGRGWTYIHNQLLSEMYLRLKQDLRICIKDHDPKVLNDHETCSIIAYLLDRQGIKLQDQGDGPLDSGKILARLRERRRVGTKHPIATREISEIKSAFDLINPNELPRLVDNAVLVDPKEVEGQILDEVPVAFEIEQYQLKGRPGPKTFGWIRDPFGEIKSLGYASVPKGK